MGDGTPGKPRGLDDVRVVTRRDGATLKPVPHSGVADINGAGEGCSTPPNGKKYLACHAVQTGLPKSLCQSLSHRKSGYTVEMEVHERLKSARENAGFETAADAARRFGWPVVTYRHHENGTRGFKKNAGERYARAFRVNPAWLLLGSGGPEKRTVPLVGYVGAGAEVHAVDDGSGQLDEIDPPPGIGPNAVAVMVRGDSMWPRYMDGDVLIYDQHMSPSNANGQECVVALTDGRRYVKTVRKTSDGYDLESWNAPPIRNVQIEWAASILWVRRA